MAFYNGHSTFQSLHHCDRPILSIRPLIGQNFCAYNLLIWLYSNCSTNRRLSTGPESPPPEFSGKNAYDLLGVSESSSFLDIKAAFRKLAKETHPDLAQSSNDLSNSRQFIQILAAYEILSDSQKRAHYDRYLLSQKIFAQRHSRQGLAMYRYESRGAMTKQMEVVEWLRWYRYAINDILSEKRVVGGSGYFDVLESDFHSAIHAAYYGPEIESMDLLPNCFEADERSVYGTSEVLHLVSGRCLFGMVRVAVKAPELEHTYNEKLSHLPRGGSALWHSGQNSSIQISSEEAGTGSCQMHGQSFDYRSSDAFKDLELHVSGRVVAVATRVPPKNYSKGRPDEGSQDHIHVYLNTHEDPTFAARDSIGGVAVGSRIPVGTITGLGTSDEEGSCFVYNKSGIKTHVIMKHRTLLVKHMHWYEMGNEASVCECRCTRARLPPSKFWLFEPRCGLHDIGGWYVETFGKDKKGRTVPSQRYWDGLDANEHFEKRLHPAIYLLALAYRTLDIEDAKRRNQKVRDMVEGKMFKILKWCKKLI